jgi:hypothetical protein
MRSSSPAWLRREGRIAIGTLHETEVTGLLDSFVRAIERERGFEIVRGDTWVRFHGPYDRKFWEWDPDLWKVESAQVRIEAGTPGYAYFELSTLDEFVESAFLAVCAAALGMLATERIPVSVIAFAATLTVLWRWMSRLMTSKFMRFLTRSLTKAGTAPTAERIDEELP